MANSVIQTIRDAEVDARSLSEFISKDASFTVTRRLAPTIHTLDYYLLVLSQVKDKGDLADIAISDTLDKLEQLEPTVIQRVEDAINNTAVEGGVLADTFVVVDGSLSQRTINKGLESIADLSTINNPKDGLRVYVKSYYAGLAEGGGQYEFKNASDVDAAKDIFVDTADPNIKAVLLPTNGFYDITQLGVSSTAPASSNAATLSSKISGVSNLNITVSKRLPIGQVSFNNASVKIAGTPSSGFFAEDDIANWFSFSADTDVSIDGILFDGRWFAERAIRVDGNAVIKNCEIKNLTTRTVSAFGVGVYYKTSVNKTATIKDCKIHDTGGTTGGYVGESVGATRAILVNMPDSPSANCFVHIEDNELYDIYAREGDIIHCSDYLADDVSASATSRVYIIGNKFGGSNRRGVKVQGNHVTIEGNVFKTIDKDHPNYVSDSAGIIALINTPNQNSLKGNSIKGNTFHNYAGIKESIYLVNQDYVVVEGNTHHGYVWLTGGFLVVQNGNKKVLIKNNIVNGNCATSFMQDLSFDADISLIGNIYNISGNSYRAISDSSVAFPSKFVMSDNIFEFSPEAASSMLGVYSIPSGVGGEVSANNVIIKNNIIRGQASPNRAFLLYLPNIDNIKVKSMLFAGNSTDGTSLIYNGNKGYDLSESVVVGNTTKNGVFAPTV